MIIRLILYMHLCLCNLCVSLEAKEQVLSNLANFAYDPKNMEYLRELQVLDLFLDMLTEENENFVEFGIGECKKATFFKLSTALVSLLPDPSVGRGTM